MNAQKGSLCLAGLLTLLSGDPAWSAESSSLLSSAFQILMSVHRILCFVHSAASIPLAPMSAHVHLDMPSETTEECAEVKSSFCSHLGISHSLSRSLPLVCLWCYTEGRMSGLLSLGSCIYTGVCCTPASFGQGSRDWQNSIALNTT